MRIVPSGLCVMFFARAIAMGIVAILGLATAATAAQPSVLTPIHTFVNAANNGDRSRLISVFSTDSAIVDEFAPFRFAAPNAAAHWYDGFAADQAANAVTAAVIASSTPKFITVAGTRAYVVLPTVYTYQVNHKPAKETGSLAFTLIERNAQWKISAMSWAKLSDTSVP